MFAGIKHINAFINPDKIYYFNIPKYLGYVDALTSEYALLDTQCGFQVGKIMCVIKEIPEGENATRDIICFLPTKNIDAYIQKQEYIKKKKLLQNKLASTFQTLMKEKGGIPISEKVNCLIKLKVNLDPTNDIQKQFIEHINEISALFCEIQKYENNS